MQIRSGQAMVTSGDPNRITFNGMSPSDAALLGPGQLFKFADETTTGFFTIANVVSANEPAIIDLIDDYSGSHQPGSFAAYVITRDFTPIHALPELSPGDVDIRTVYTTAVRAIDAVLTGRIIASGLTEVTAAASTVTITGTFRVPPYGVLATPTWLTTVRFRADGTQTSAQFILDFGTAAPPGGSVAWAVFV